MKKILALSFFVMMFSVSGFGQFKFGAGAQLFDSYFGVGGKGHYTITEDFAAQASFHYYFESEVTVWTLDLDVHYSGFGIGDLEGFRLSPFAGLNFWNFSVDTGTIFGDIGGNTTNLNIGINGTLPLTDSMDLYIEPKIVIGSGSTFAVGAGVYF